MATTNIVFPGEGWVCGWVAKMLAERLSATASTEPKPGTNIYMPYYLLHNKSERDIPIFTHHCEQNSEAWSLAAGMADVCVAMSNRTAGALPSEKTVTLEIPADPQFHKDRLVLGISGRSYADSRKRLDWVHRLLEIPRVSVHYSGGQVGWERMPAWYEAIDYLLVLSDNEGGPMGVKEAIAMGKPVITPNVGWCWDYPVIRYEGWEELEGIIRKLTPAPDGWDIFADKVGALC